MELDNPVTLKEAIFGVAQLGGFLGRKGDGNPGTQTIWRGMRILGMLSIFYEKIVTNPKSIFCYTKRYG